MLVSVSTTSFAFIASTQKKPPEIGGSGTTVSMPLREVYTVSLPGQAEDEVRNCSAVDGIISSCAWSEDGLLALTIGAGKSKDYFRKSLSYTASPAIYVFHVDRPEAHSLLTGGHDYDIFSLSWAPRQLGICLLSADIRTALCVWRPVQGLVNRWQLHHRLLLSSPKLAMWMNPSPIFSLPANPAVQGKPASYDSKYRKDQPTRPDPASLPATGPPFTRPTSESGLAGPRCPHGHMCIVGVTRYGEARVYLETVAGAAQGEWMSSAVRLCTHEVSDSSKGRATVSEGTLYVQAATGALRDGNLLLAVADENQARIRSAPLLSLSLSLSHSHSPSPSLSPSCLFCFALPSLSPLLTAPHRLLSNSFTAPFL